MSPARNGSGGSGQHSGGGGSSSHDAGRVAHSSSPSHSQWLAKALAGTGAGVAATALCSPLDVAKTRIQVQSSVAAQAKYSGIMQALMTIYREEGFAGWYHGFTPAVCSVGVFWTVYFPCYDHAKESISRSTGLLPTSPMLHIAAAGCAGLVRTRRRRRRPALDGAHPHPHAHTTTLTLPPSPSRR